MDNYIQFSLEDLILVAVYSIKSRKEDCTFERLVKECFTLFPKKFSFSRYPQWPDSLKLDRPLRKLQERKLLLGNRTVSYDLSPVGRKVCLKVLKRLKISGIIPPSTATNTGRKEKRILDRVRQSDLFHEFLSKKGKFRVSNPQIRTLFLCTMETPLKVVIQNINYVQDLAKELKDKSLSNFLIICENQIKGV